MLSARTRLSIMMFLQYFVWGSWAVAAGGYMGETLAFDGPSIGSIYSSTALGAIFAPLFVGFVADRYFSTERILAALHLIGGGLLLVAATQTEFKPLMIIMVAYALCYMPTLALTNSISFQNIGDPEKEFPRIRVYGTAGWIVAGLIVGILLGGTSNHFFYLGGGASVVLAAWCLLLPHTPPRGKSDSDVLGLGAVGLLKEPSFAIFALCSFLVCIPLSFYYGFANQFLVQTDRPVPTALQTLGQFSEIFFMAAMPFFIVRLGVKKMLLVGMLAWVARYLCFSTLDFPLVLVGLLLHGVCYDFFFVASQIYVDKKAPRDMRASAQSLIAFITLGLGMFAGAYVSGWIVGQYPAVAVNLAEADGKTQSVALPNWASMQSSSGGVLEKLDPAVIRQQFFKDSKKPTERGPDFAATNDANQNGTLELGEIPEMWIEKPDLDKSSLDIRYPGESLREVFPEIDKDGDGSITRAEWRTAQANDWRKIWIWPAMMAGITSLIFWLGFHDRVAETHGTKQ